MPTVNMHIAFFVSCVVTGLVTGLADFHNIPVLLLIFALMFMCLMVGWNEGRKAR